MIVVLLMAKLNDQETIHHIEAAFVFNVQIALALDWTATSTIRHAFKIIFEAEETLTFSELHLTCDSTSITSLSS